MAHREQMSFVESVKRKFPDNFVSSKVLEVGSYNVNGSVRQFFDNCVYVGLDVFPGNCVDVVCSGHLYGASDNTFDCCISCECFEHNPFWKETFLNMFRMLKSGGILIFTCATTGRPEHGTKRTSPLKQLHKRLGYYAIVLNGDGFVRHIGYDRHIKDPTNGV